jgi:large subunit ribosomal protein L17
MVVKVFDELAQRYASRTGGYTRVVRMEPRRGDGASMALLELIQ